MRPPSRAHPRLRGEHQLVNGFLQAFHGSSPLTRGAPVTGGILQVLNRLIPAYAGAPSSPPSVRSRYGLIPAYAGSTGRKNAPIFYERAHPRLRGEHVAGVFLQLVAVRLIPAYAGSTLSGHISPESTGAHPRLRGEHASRASVTTLTLGSSPLTRGARLQPVEAVDADGLIPAYAGSTHITTPSPPSPGAHPRLRGEHDVQVTDSAAWEGSSPLTRGARRSPNRIRGSVRLIPAYAGSTTPRRAWRH